MRLLVITQKVDHNDDVLGFFHAWLLEFAKKCDQVTVICLWKGSHTLPAHVRVLSLGKESGVSRLTYIVRFFRYIWRERGNYDAVFVHMNQIYVVLGGFVWRSLGKKIGLWYVHRQTSFSLWLAEKFTHVIFTAAPESFNLRSRKVHILGHGIDTAYFVDPQSVRVPDRAERRIVTIGRITRIKNLDIFIEAARLIRDRGTSYQFDIVGAATTDADHQYEQELRALVQTYNMGDTVHFVGSVPYKNIREVYWNSDLSINLTPTGGLDKVVLESMAAGVPCIVSNNAFRPHLAHIEPHLLFEYRNPEQLAENIEIVLRQGDAVAEQSRRYVIEHFSLHMCVNAILDFIRPL